jgi:hypothetical protein
MGGNVLSVNLQLGVLVTRQGIRYQMGGEVRFMFAGAATADLPHHAADHCHCQAGAHRPLLPSPPQVADGL